MQEDTPTRQPTDRLTLTEPGEQEREILLASPGLAIGRATVNEIVLRDPQASRTHARLEAGDEGWTLVDQGSANGTRLNGVWVKQASLLPGDVITIGRSTLRFESGAPPDEPGVTLLDSAADLQRTLAQGPVSMTTHDTHLPRLAVHLPGKTWEAPLMGEALTIGRQSGNDIVLITPKASRRHARIERRGDEFVIRDLESANGTWVGGKRVEERTLRDGDTIRIGEARLIFKRGFDPADLTLLEARVPSGGPARRTVVVVPGLMGSELWRGSERVWPDVRTLFTEPELFGLPEQTPLEPRGLVHEVVIVPNLIKQEQYNRLGDYLEEGLGYERDRDLFEFAYDWRQDVRQSAKKLAGMMHGLSAAPVTIIAHSLGCLVSRYYVERLGGKDKVERLILLGSPHAGVPRAVTSLMLRADLLPYWVVGRPAAKSACNLPLFLSNFAYLCLHS